MRILVEYPYFKIVNNLFGTQTESFIVRSEKLKSGYKMKIIPEDRFKKKNLKKNSK